MEDNQQLIKLELTLMQLNHAFQSVQKFDSTINFREKRDQMRETHQKTKQDLIQCLQETQQARLRLENLSVSSRKGTISIEEPQMEKQEEKAKRRRRSQQIEKVYKCSFNKCDKCYGSEVSLSYHMKMKHGFIYSRRKQTLQNF